MRKKVGIITLHLNFGGAELASVNLANMLSEKYDVTIINMYKSSIPYKLNDNVHIAQLSDMYPNKDEFKQAINRKNIFKIFKEGILSLKILRARIKLVKKHLKENNYDYLISSRALYTKLINNLKCESKKIAVEHRHHNNDIKYINYLIKNTNNIDCFVSVSKELNEFYTKKLNCRCEYIPNALESVPDEESLDISKKENIIIAVGRFEKEKGFLDLIKVFEKIEKMLPEYKLVLVGDGSLKKEIIEEIKKRNLESKVELTGFIEKDKLNKLYEKSKLYLMTSFEESFGLVVGEAESYKIPVIAFSSATGAVEMLNGTGIIVENRDIDKMAKEAINLLQSDDYTIIANKAYLNIKRFEFNEVKKDWERLLEKL